ncbi:preprotein translocase subunit SecY [[Clostridium] colinum]|uniref:preprotein translocase subunit SecY n=1 Tax=[Clostridium] colinum TaxID=36835 RepID=UPI002025AB94|nr:preprotein translocase subunit SecY [[Clostridium] colinum]
MFSTFRNAWKVPELRKRIIFMVLMILVIRIGTKVTVPGINIADLGTNTNSTLYSIITGGAFGTIFALGIGPYITSSIIMQLLTVAIPKLEQLNKEGEQGRNIINKYTRVLAVVLAFMQAIGQILFLRGAFVYQNAFVYFVAALSMVAGTMFVMWLGERLTEKGIGNGTSFIIFANILASLPQSIKTIYVDTVGGGTSAYVKAGIIVVLFVLLIAFVILVQDGERRIPVQYSKKMVGRKMYGGQSTFIPIKVNIAGVMSIIFAISILQFPQTIAQLWQTPPSWLQEVVRILNITNPVGAILYIILIFCFTSFYTSFSFNPIEVAENMKKNGGFIPGIRPGKPTSDFIQNVVNKISLIGACFYAFIAIVPVLFEWIFKINIGFGGTTLLIVTGVALEVVKQLDSQLLMRNYKGFLG